MLDHRVDFERVAHCGREPLACRLITLAAWHALQFWCATMSVLAAILKQSLQNGSIKVFAG